MVSVTHKVEEANKEGATTGSRVMTVAVVTWQCSGDGHGCVNGPAASPEIARQRKRKALEMAAHDLGSQWRLMAEACNGGLQWRGGMSGKKCGQC